jgi:hypothetical protein
MKKLTFLLFFALGTPVMQADVIYTNFGASPFDTGNGLAVSSGGSDYSLSFSFVVPPSFNYQLTGIDFAAFLKSGVNSITATLYSDNGGVPGGFVYSTGAISSALQPQGSASELMEAVSNGPTLNAGGTYWLTLDSNDASSVITWSYNGPGAFGPETTFTGESGWATPQLRTQGAFEIDATIVSPEPATTALVASGLAAAVWFRRRKSKSH